MKLLHTLSVHIYFQLIKYNADTLYLYLYYLHLKSPIKSHDNDILSRFIEHNFGGYIDVINPYLTVLLI